MSYTTDPYHHEMMMAQHQQMYNQQQMYHGGGGQQDNDVMVVQLEQEPIGYEYYSQMPTEESTLIEEQQIAGEGQQLTVKDFDHGVQERDFVISKTVSLQELQDDPSARVWRPSAARLRDLKQIKSTMGRDKPQDKDLIGDLSRCIPLKMEVVEYGSGAPAWLAANIHGMVRSKITEKGKYTWVFPPAHGQAYHKTVNECITKPNNIFDRVMYKTWKKCDHNTLKEEIKYDDKDGVAIVRTDGVVYEVLRDNMLEGTWENLPVNEILEAVENHGVRRIEIPMDVAQHIEEWIKPRLDNIDKAFVNWNDFNVEFFRADGATNWADTRGLVGNLADTGKGKSALSDRKLNERFSVWMRIKTRYVLY